MEENYIFDFEKLVVYKKAVEFTNNVFRLTKKFSKEVQFSLGDQFRRAALSICNNLAEGSGKTTVAAKRQYYNISLNSARECIPVISVAVEQRELDKADGLKLREDCIVICRMLFKLIVSTK